MKLIVVLLLVVNTSTAADITFLPKGSKTPYEGFLMDSETLMNINEKAKNIIAAESALIVQNDILIEVQKQKIVLEFDKQIIQDKYDVQNAWVGTLYFVIGFLIIAR